VSLWRPDYAGVGIGVGEVCRCDAAGTVLARQRFDVHGASSDHGKAQQLAGALRALLMPAGSARAPKARLVVADSLARYWLMEPPADVRSLADLQGVARARSQQLYGVAQHWQIAADWNARHPFLCAALPEWVGDGMRQVAGAAGQVEAVLPLVLRRAPVAKGDTWMCMTSPHRVAVLAFSAGKPRSMRALPTSADDSLEAQLHVATREMRRESLRTGMPLGDSVEWWHLGGPSTLKEGVVGIEVDGMQFLPRSGPALYRRPAAACSDAHAAAAMALSF